jgi:hypothetical protein
MQQYVRQPHLNTATNMPTTVLPQRQQRSGHPQEWHQMNASQEVACCS